MISIIFIYASPIEASYRSSAQARKHYPIWSFLSNHLTYPKGKCSFRFAFLGLHFPFSPQSTGQGTRGTD